MFTFLILKSLHQSYSVSYFKVFVRNTDDGTAIVKEVLLKPFFARHVRFTILTWEARAKMAAEIYVCPRGKFNAPRHSPVNCLICITEVISVQKMASFVFLFVVLLLIISFHAIGGWTEHSPN